MKDRHSYYHIDSEERGRGTDQFFAEPTGYDAYDYEGLGAVRLAKTPPRLVGTVVRRHPARVVQPISVQPIRKPIYGGRPAIRTQPSPPPASIRVPPKISVTNPGQRITIRRGADDPLPTITRRSVAPSAPPPPAGNGAPPLTTPPAGGGAVDPDGLDELLDQLEDGAAELVDVPAVQAVRAPAKKPFPWKTVGLIAGGAAVFYYLTRGK